MSPAAPGPATATRGDLVALLALCLVAALAVVSLVAAWLGVHDGRSCLLLAVAVTALGAATQRQRWPESGWARRDALVPVVVLVALASFLPGFGYGAKLDDPGVYVLHARAIARTGDLAAPDPLFDADVAVDTSTGGPRLVTDEGDVAVRGVAFRGLSTSSDSVDEFVPSFLHLWPALLATVHDLVGLDALFATGPVLGALALGLLFVGVRRAVGVGAGLAAVAFLALNLLQVWQVRFPTSEVLAQFLLVGAGTAFVVALDRGWRAPGVLAGALVGAAYLARADGLFVVLVVSGLLAGAWVLDRWGPVPAGVLAGLVPTVALGALQAYGPAAGYTENQRGAPDLALVVAALGLLVAIAAAARVALRADRPAMARARQALGRERTWRTLATGLAVALAVYLVFSWFRIDLLGEHLRVNRAGELTRDYDELSLRRLSWVVTVPALLLAGVGLAVAARRPRAALLALVPALALLPVYLWDPRIAPFLLWWGRRFVPLVLPLVAVLLGVAAHWALADRHRLRSAAGVGVAVLLGATLLLEARALPPVLGHRELDGSVAVIDAVERVAGPDGVLVWQGGTTATRLFAAVPVMTDGRVSIVGPAAPTGDEVAAIARAFGDRPVYLVAEPGSFDDDPERFGPVTGVITRLPRFVRDTEQLPAGAETLVADMEMARVLV